uniref:Uncharacterized protein n=1 Tax=Rhizophagus irregularis (strain DAOM 181602 / DAOM 197198 / MUCL 43194) TaxID=747089 RepID=U9TKD2_RHIID
METLEHFFTYFPEVFPLSENNTPSPIFSRNILLELMDQFLTRLAQKASSFPKVLHREIYHQLWRPRCKMKSFKDKALDIMPALFRITKSSNFTNFHYDTSSVTFFLANKSHSSLQASKWSFLVKQASSDLVFWLTGFWDIQIWVL